MEDAFSYLIFLVQFSISYILSFYYQRTKKAVVFFFVMQLLLSFSFCVVPSSFSLFYVSREDFTPRLTTSLLSGYDKGACRQSPNGVNVLVNQRIQHNKMKHNTTK